MMDDKMSKPFANNTPTSKNIDITNDQIELDDDQLSLINAGQMSSTFSGRSFNRSNMSFFVFAAAETHRE